MSAARPPEGARTAVLRTQGNPVQALPADFAPRLIHWQARDGRHGLPWQGTRDPYRVWLSEIMLQQTQVSTVLAYYPRFLERFPDVAALAAAPIDEVMALWSGLGYYSRARNLHRCAQAVVADHAGRFPATAAGLEALPGIGASTAAAIAAFCFGERVSIVDGNVKRVLARLLAYDGDVGQAASQRALWDLAQGLLPLQPSDEDMRAYTQGLMDLGATVCTRTRPRCEVCPARGLCLAFEREAIARYPVKTRRVQRRFERWWLLFAVRDDAVWLQRRPERGIWAGLHSPPVFAGEDDMRAAVPAGWPSLWTATEPVAHALTHRELQLLPHWVAVDEAPAGWAGEWVKRSALAAVGLPAPVRSLLGGAWDPQVLDQ
ncbi:A/G-specific adenine glycosylase [Hydrogenophaga sp. YM1]|uniref:A/G-specific adenine glycosylase n=1 Tax=Hydrogenophaga sp. YM1 TaxID=2806262 RepID=UPI00195C499E|nr:A/G-specific adenine glycosylase [Hydrogenophaga sp. YM1]QRR33206.1 A/G-specific adenine glycosylase [Hydrogenophaga sp. YM1]